MILKANSHSRLRCWSQEGLTLFRVKSNVFINGRYWSLAYRTDRNRAGFGSGYWCYAWGMRTISWHWSFNWSRDI